MSYTATASLHVHTSTTMHDVMHDVMEFRSFVPLNSIVRAYIHAVAYVNVGFECEHEYKLLHRSIALYRTRVGFRTLRGTL